MIQLVPAETFIGHNSTFLYLLGVFFFWLNANEMSGCFQHNLSQSCDPDFNNNKTVFFPPLKPTKDFFSSQLKLK